MIPLLVCIGLGTFMVTGFSIVSELIRIRIVLERFDRMTKRMEEDR